MTPEEKILLSGFLIWLDNKGYEIAYRTGYANELVPRVQTNYELLKTYEEDHRWEATQ